MKQFLITFFIVVMPFCGWAQKKALSLDDYDAWQSISQKLISNDGRYAVCVSSAQDGDGKMYVVNTSTYATTVIPRATQAQISDNSKFAVFVIKAPKAALKEAKRKKLSLAKQPQDSIGIINFESGEIEKIANAQSFSMPEKASNYFAYILKPQKDDTKVKSDSAKNDTTKNVKKNEKKEYLIIKNLEKLRTDTIKNVTGSGNYNIEKNGKYLSYIINEKGKSKDTTIKNGVYLYNINDAKSRPLKVGKGKYKLPEFDDEGSQLAFFASNDTAKKATPRYTLYYAQCADPQLKIVADSNSVQLPEKWEVNTARKPQFSKNGKKLYFGISPIIPPKDTTKDASELASVVVWHYNDDFLQPAQSKRLTDELNRSYLCVSHINNLDFKILGTQDVAEVYTADNGNAERAWGLNNIEYRKETQWTGMMKNDIYVISTSTGQKTLVAKALAAYPSISPNGNFIAWFNRDEAKWYIYNADSEQTICLNEKMKVNFYDEKNSVPNKPNAYGIMGWDKNENYIYIYDAYDIWRFAVNADETPVNITNGYGRDNKITFRNIRLDRENNFIDTQKTLLLSAFDNTSKECGFFTLDINNNENILTERLIEKYTHIGNRNQLISNAVKAKNADVFIFSKSNFNTSPDIWVTHDFWQTERKITDINPQMRDFLWGTPELVKWKSKDGTKLQGILYKPENFDENAKYPMIIYFYEEHSDNLYRYFAPAPSASTINISEYCSNGYLVFTPDIHYVDGHPGRSAYNSIVAGAEKLCKNTWVDKDHIAIQGQSWGGYQVAYLVTKTDMFAAAGAGAPVSNMTSAYGGVRWESGVVRQMQYEKQQSRIGKNLWDGFDLYIENSPIFHAKNVKTPLLIMHNDNDGAVPWYQGIEYFTALRRLNKTVWMLQYRQESHNLAQRRNRKDLSLRLKQFFDHYLKDAPMPVWMRDGIPATKEGRTYSLELTEQE